MLALAGLSVTAVAQTAVSPNGNIVFEAGEGNGVVRFRGQKVLEVRIPVTAGMLEGATSHLVTADYTMISGKRRYCVNKANEYRLGSLVLRLYDDGLAFRFEQPGGEAAYVIPEGTKRWMQQWTDAYEGFFPLSTTSKVRPEPSFSRRSLTPDGFNNHWGYPLLVEPADGVFALITEANMERGQSASSLYSDGEVFRVVPDETVEGKSIDRSPWRVVIVGTLADVVESTLVTDVSDPCRLGDTAWIEPGVVSWVYWAYNHGSNDYEIIRKYVDLAATLHLPYVLIDAEWDEMKDGKTVEDAVAYALERGVRPMIWYSSSIGWVDGAPGPKFRLNKPEDREREFAWCERIGVAGVKVDFFSGDTQENMDYCIDLMEDAARHHLLINFHGATVPRGWQRTYPNLLSTEGVYGAEWYNNVPTFTKRAAGHNATLPFTRNVIGPMDYTPCAFSDSQHPHITTHAHELALTALFESGLQHLADRPESFLAQPWEVRDYLSHLPAAWDDTRYVSGYPGKSAVLARRSGDTWYVAGINGLDEPQTLPVPLDFLDGMAYSATLFADGIKPEEPWNIRNVKTLPETVTCRPRGGFLWVIRTTTQGEDEQQMRDWIRTMASDEFGGRKPMTAYEDLTVNYLAEQMGEMGLEPAFDGSWYQPFEMIAVTAKPVGGKFTVKGKKKADLHYPEDLVVWTARATDKVDLPKAEYVFCGFGIHAPEYGWDDYAGIDVEGKIVIAMVNDPGYYDPSLFRGRNMTYYGRWLYKFEEARRQGAAGCLVLHNTEAASYGWHVCVNGHLDGNLALFDSDTRNADELAVKGWLHEDGARKIFTAAGMDLDAALAAAKCPGFRSFPLKVRGDVRMDVSYDIRQTRNVGAVLRGTDKKDEVVVLNAHWYHLGVGTSDETGDTIYNGAADNASGMAGVLLAAKKFLSLPETPRRSVLFLFPSSEESGLFGSEYYCAHPAFPMEKTAACLNFESIGPAELTRDVVILGGGESSLDAYYVAAAAAQGRYIFFDDDNSDGWFFRSDHYNFVKKGVPAVVVENGLHPADPSRPNQYPMASWYHKPSDEYREDWDLEGTLANVNLIFSVGVSLANAEVSPK